MNPSDLSEYQNHRLCLDKESLKKPLVNLLIYSCRAILNVAGMGRFSSDRSVLEYAEVIWNVKPLLRMQAGSSSFRERQMPCGN